jgi:hypothetical protein
LANCTHPTIGTRPLKESLAAILDELGVARLVARRPGSHTGLVGGFGTQRDAFEVQA